MFPLLLFVLGAIVGSFLNVCIYRLPRRESVSTPPSHCPSCNTRLRALDLVPLLSQFILRGKCRYCGAKFSWRYFGIELLTGILFALVAFQPGNLSGDGFLAAWTGDYVKLLRDLIFMATLVVIFWVDYDTKLVQLESTFLLGLSALVYEAWKIYQGQNITTDGAWFAFALPAPVPEAILAGLAAGSVLWILRALFSMLYGREAMGLGDVFIAAAAAMHLGWNATIFTFFFLASVLGAFIGVGFQIPRAVRSYRWGQIRSRRSGKPSLALPLARNALRKVMPFGPMLAIGAIAALLYGPQLNQAYLKWTLPPDAQPVSSLESPETR
jgi:leader peptidase (prepilin peptidase)/N-methyltransferase